LEIRAQSVQPVGPCDCALAVAIPLTRQQFLHDLSQSGEKGFAKYVKTASFQPGTSDEYYWEVVYGPIARAAERICANAERLGVTVNRATRLADIFTLLGKFKVVTLVTHWRFMKLRPIDVLDPVGLLSALRAPRTLVGQAVQRSFRELRSELLDEDVLCESQEQLRVSTVEVLNEIIGAAHGLYQPVEHIGDHKDKVQLAVGLSHSRPLERLTRAALELSFAGQIESGKAVEFVDGMKTISEVIQQIPITFTGLLDLTICNSVILGEAIKNYRPDCLVAVNRYPAELHVRLGIYALTILLLSTRQMSYMDALGRVSTKQF
jgi:hypothetical protein